MKLILHIGTHKTGSTDLQFFLRSNADRLHRRGVYYAAPQLAVGANQVADHLSAGYWHLVEAFFNSHLAAARRIGVHTMLVSAENFYAMTTVRALRDRRNCRSEMHEERRLIGGLYQVVASKFDGCRIVCYLRRPDEFVESWYNQHIKGSSLFTGTFEDFLAIAYPALLYASHLTAWSEAFGHDRCSPRLYEGRKTDVVTDFVSHELEIDHSDFSRRGRSPNERLSRELLEFCRERNGAIDRGQKPFEYELLGILEKRLGSTWMELPCYGQFLAPRQRATLLDRLEPELAALQQLYGLPPFPSFDSVTAQEDWTPYPGLSEERSAQIEREYLRRVQGSGRSRLRRWAAAHKRRRGKGFWSGRQEWNPRPSGRTEVRR